MLSLSPRYDLFKFSLPKDFLPKEIEEKYAKLLNGNNEVISSPIEYLNESIKGINIPGITEVNIQQQQHSTNSFVKSNTNNLGLGKLNTEPKVDINYITSSNPLSNINREFKVTFRMNQGLYNYFMLYETIFYHICKPLSKQCEDFLYIDILDETGVITSRIKLIDCYLDGIDGLDFTYNKTERDSGEFDILFKFNNIDYEFLTDKKKEP